MAAGLNIVLVEDNADLCRLLSEALRAGGHRVSAYESAEAMLEDRLATEAEVFILDINLPGEDGLSLAHRLRQSSTRADIILLTARQDLRDRVKGYDSGADLYLVKPVHMPELWAALRRFGVRRGRDDAAVAQELPIVLQTRVLRGPLAEVRLTADEAMLLVSFVRAPQGQLASWQLANLLDVTLDEKLKSNLAIRMSRLRKKLLQVGASGTPIQSLRELGYQLMVKVHTDA